MTEHTPTTAEVRERFIDGFPFDTWVVARAAEGEAFDAWLAEHDAQVWDQGWVSAMQYEGRCQDAEAAGQGVLITKPKNPYRAEAARLRRASSTEQ